jgi:hypothetical protein
LFGPAALVGFSLLETRKRGNTMKRLWTFIKHKKIRW